MELVSAWSMHTNIKRQSWERITCSDLGPALASLLSNIFATTQERWKSTPGQRLKATSIRVYKMRIKERRHRNTNPPWRRADWQQRFFRSKLDEAAGLLAADGLLTTRDVWKRAGIYIFAVILSFSLFRVWLESRTIPRLAGNWPGAPATDSGHSLEPESHSLDVKLRGDSVVVLNAPL